MTDRSTLRDIHRVERRIPRVTHFIFTSPLSRVWKLSALTALYSVPAVLYPGFLHVGFPLEALLSFGVGLMLSVRLSSSYNRWWEARTQWGALVNVSRNLAVKLRTYASLSSDESIELHTLIQGFARSLKNHLRGKGSLSDIRGFADSKQSPVHVPSHISLQIYGFIERLRSTGRLNDTQVLIVDAESRMLLEVCGACERIKNTLMSPSFPAFIQFCLILLLASMPWELASKLGWLTIPVMALASFVAVAGEVIAEANERPFGLGTDDLDLESYCDGIDRSTAELLTVPHRVR